ncbi:MAG: DUF3488 and DUF4129 domain-containing transglutaminase family protein [Halobacteriales archaeon]
MDRLLSMTLRGAVQSTLERVFQRYLGRPFPGKYELLAGISAGVLTLSYLSLLFYFVDVVGGVELFVVEMVVVLILSYVLSQRVPVRWAVILGGSLLVIGVGVYLALAPAAYVNITRQITDTIAILTGLSILRTTNAEIWTLAVMPGPVFVSWFFFFRRQYTYGVAVGGATLGLFVLSGDAGTVLTLVGVLGAIGTLGFGDLDRGLRGRDRGGDSRVGRVGRSISRQLSRRMFLMGVATTSISIIPGDRTKPLLLDFGTPTMEGGLLSNPEQVSIPGSVRLSPAVRFTVSADRPAFWRVGAYDRYTSSDWIRTGRSQPYTGPLTRPEGRPEQLRQAFRAESAIDTMPAAWKPVDVDTQATDIRVTDLEGFRPTGGLEAGDRYDVESYRPSWSPEQLRGSERDYPSVIENRYLQLPQSTSSRIGEFTSDLLSSVDNPYDAALRIKRWLDTNKGYSLEVERPNDDIAGNFIFEMNQGYCVYFATAMVVMLRTQGIPARFVVGYTPGQQVEDNRWVIRGYHSHAWVEVYFEDVGWIEFDPTPSTPRRAAESTRLQQARVANEAGIDTNESVDVGPGSGSSLAAPGEEAFGDEYGPVGDTFVNPNRSESRNETTPASSGGEIAADRTTDATDSSGGTDLSLPDQRTVLYGLLLITGIGIGIRRIAVLERLYRVLWLRKPPTGSTVDRVTGAYDRLEYLLGRAYRDRRLDETPREYLTALQSRDLDSRIDEVFRLYERARYGGNVDDESADRAVRLTRELIRHFRRRR